MKRILITGGAGFVGSYLARKFKEEFSQAEVVVMDNLKRRGSEINLPILKRCGIHFEHGDIRCPSDFENLKGHFDLFIEASAEPSVLAGVGDASPKYALDSNLVGTLHALDFAKQRCGLMLFLSTSRVYSIPELKKIKLEISGTRFNVQKNQEITGIGTNGGIQESFSTSGFRSIYGSTKLASELLIEEYVHGYGLKAVINRCGVIAGPGQFGKVDQGVFTYWVARHYFQKPLQYNGFGGQGLQVRDIMHPQDLFEALKLQLSKSSTHFGDVFNLGGGLDISVSLKELTFACEKITGNKVEIKSNELTADVDVPYYVTDYSKAERAFGFRPRIKCEVIISEIYDWIKKNEASVREIFI